MEDVLIVILFSITEQCFSNLTCNCLNVNFLDIMLMQSVMRIHLQYIYKYYNLFTLTTFSGQSFTLSTLPKCWLREAVPRICSISEQDNEGVYYDFLDDYIGIYKAISNKWSLKKNLFIYLLK